MAVSISSSFMKIYFWSAASVILSLIAMLVVVPRLSENIELFGLYSVCLSISVYLSYSDLGFISAGQKFAAEAFKRNETLSELSFTGFSIFILILMFIPFSFLSVFLSVNPEVLINNLSSENRGVASSLLLIVGLLLPVQVTLERLASFILSIRLKEFVVLRINIVVNIVKICSVYFFFSADNYMLTQYYLFITLISILGSLFAFINIKWLLNYDFLLLVKNIKFQSDVFNQIGKLALTSFLLTISFVFYFHLDSIFIAKLIGIEAVAFFAVGFTLLTFLKTIINIVYSPFSHYLNHQAAIGEDYGLTIQKILIFSLPAYLIAITVMVIISKYLVPFWVGAGYQASIGVLELLFLSLLFNWINAPASYFYVTALKYRYQYVLSVLIPITFTIFLVCTYETLGIEAFAWAKILVGGVISIVACFSLRSIIDVKEILVPSLVPVLAVLLSIIFLFPNYLQELFPVVKKSSQDLLLLLVISAVVVLISYLVVIVCSSYKRNYFLLLFARKS